MNKLLLLLLLLPFAALAQNEPVVFKVVGNEAEEEELLAEQDSLFGLGFLVLGIRRTGLPAD